MMHLPVRFPGRSIRCILRALITFLASFAIACQQIKTGVPQGSILGLTRFLLHVNDFLFSAWYPIRSYADDSIWSSLQHRLPKITLQMWIENATDPWKGLVHRDLFHLVGFSFNLDLSSHNSSISLTLEYDKNSDSNDAHSNTSGLRGSWVLPESVGFLMYIYYEWFRVTLKLKIGKIYATWTRDLRYSWRILSQMS